MSLKVLEAKNKYFYVSYDKERVDTQTLISLIAKDEWLDSSTTIVTCSPKYSSRLSQTINHKLSYLNNNELYDTLSLETPTHIHPQVWNDVEQEYQAYDTYLKKWMDRNIDSQTKYLFIDVYATNLSKIRTAGRRIQDDCKFGSLYLQAQQTYTPDFYIQRWEGGSLLFEWQNSNTR